MSTDSFRVIRGNFTTAWNKAVNYSKSLPTEIQTNIQSWRKTDYLRCKCGRRNLIDDFTNDEFVIFSKDLLT